MLLASLAGLLPEVQASLDLLLRWAVLRICDGNMQVRPGGEQSGERVCAGHCRAPNRAWLAGV